MTKVKVCGITNLSDALISVNYGADQLGFNFYEGSPRYISTATARSIINELPYNVLKVGVFVNEMVEKICEIATVTGLDAIQLHGEEDLHFVDNLQRKSDLLVIKALRVAPEFRAEDVLGYGAPAILLDGYSTKERGGTGATFDWNIARRVSSLIEKLYLAGGLSPANVAKAIQIVRPYAVDACSHLESEPGKKDSRQLRRFIMAAKRAGAMSGQNHLR